ncbi:MAG: family 43 glycosylhydrolase [Verrucomicrobiota bacterium]
MKTQTIAWNSPQAANPFIPGYGADPSLVVADGKFYLYATRDACGENDGYAVWESPDFKNWNACELNWPTKKLCHTREGTDYGVWAPSVIQGRDGGFYLYASVGSEVWAGRADHPLGPWTNMLGDKPLIPRDWDSRYHMIDAEAFLDDDGTAYLYWGSGLDFKNGHCFAVKLKPDMHTFDGEPRDITPANYFEGPFVIKRHGRYHLMYSDGIFTDDTYCVRTAIGDTPFGPFIEQENSPILQSDCTRDILGPGHHAVFSHEGRDYILYHRHGLPFGNGGRQLCVDELGFAADGTIEKISPSHSGPDFLRGRTFDSKAATATASSSFSPENSPESVLDGNYATNWFPARDTRDPWLQLDLGSMQAIHRQEIRFGRAHDVHLFILQTSRDGKTWDLLRDATDKSLRGSPIIISAALETRYLRLTFPGDSNSSAHRVIEWQVF